ncbi:MAG: lamin tail domain-containing protein [Chitinophagales bacterium]
MNKRKLLFVACVLACQSTSAQIVINEISSRGNVLDESGDASDWIEIYNAGTTSVNLLNYGFTDDATNLFLWKFPNIDLAPGDYLLVLADGEGTINSTNHYETAIFNDDTWKYFIGSSEPPTDWNTISFDDATWSSGEGSIGYGDADDGTIITATTSVYLRKSFSIEDTALIANAILHADYDDAFVAYINGIEVARSANIGGVPPAYSEVATYDHEAALYLGGVPETFTIDEAVLNSILIEGENVLCLQFHNTSIFSSDFTSSAWLTLGITTSGSYYSTPPAWFTSTSAYNHTSFSLNTDGETIYLTDNAGMIIDQKNYGYLETYYSLSRKPDGTDAWCITNETSPGNTNNFASCISGTESEPVFDLSPGFYTGSQIVGITTTSATAVIRYTLDGSLVRETSPVYTSPITIDTTSVISAKCFSSAGKLPSKIIKNTYLLDEPSSTLPIISISADPGSFFDTDTGIYVFGPPDYSTSYPYYGSNFWEPWKRLAYISYFDETGMQQFSNEIYIEIHGGWSRAEAQRSFTIDFKNVLDGELNFQLFPDDKPEVTKFNNFNLRNGGQHVWGTRIQDAFIARVMNKTHLDYEAYNPCLVYLNGNYWGLYEIREKADEHFAESNYGINSENIDLRNGWSALAGSDTAFTNLYNWVMANDPYSSSFYEGFAEKVDIENYVDYFIAEIYHQNVDWGGTYWGLNNIKLWQENSPEGKIRHIMYDMDGSLGWFGDNVYTNYINLARYPGVTNFSSEIFDRILYNEEFRNYFVNRFADLINTIFQLENVEEIEEAMKDQIEDEMDRQIDRWALPYSYSYWNSTLNQMMNYLEDRITPARNHIRDAFALPASRNVDLEVFPAGAGHIKISTIYPDPLPWEGVYFDDVPVTITAVPNPGYTFDSWNPNGILTAGSDDQSITVTLSSSETFTAQFTGGAVEPDIIVSELNYNSDGSMNAGDWVELFNNDAITYDLSGWKLYDENEIQYFELPLGTILESGEYLVLAQDPSAFSSIYPLFVNPVGGFSFAFSNSGDKIILKDLDENVVVNFAYLDSLDWPEGADGTGRTLEILDYDYDINNPTNWFDGCMFGSPGEAYSDCDPEIVFGEINYHSAATANAGDWVELYNTTSTVLDISGWKFADKNDTLLYYFPAGSNLDAGERVALANDLTALLERHPLLTNYTGPFQFGLDGAGEELRLIDAEGKIQFSIIYNDKDPWPVEADGGGKTLELVSPIGKMNDPSNWFAGCPEGSPAVAYIPDCVVAIDDVESHEFEIYPNPASTEFFIRLNISSEQSKDTQILFCDAAGRVIHEINNPENQFLRIKRNQLASGMYTVKVITGEDIVTKKIILM